VETHAEDRARTKNGDSKDKPARPSGGGKP
jgi:hypothetical protein